ncbi:hypothetical protein [Actinoalloteichus fjordicus]|uniref:Uncharacterized protein n=1 Tax=Actinoalloteichus fjordicus TaxID=1612552 RepID=A0AAC9L9H6_9PSEU|nr:hypothetical protein [Actinoalloteichus fjordicus]APU12780.1 hypothetical protein UA74_03495 [Actinoalloteichus fjordicus]
MTFRDPAGWSVSVPARLSGAEQGESVMVSCNRVRQHVLVEGTRKTLKPVLAALTVSDARLLLTALRPAGQSLTVPAVGNGLVRRRLVVNPAVWYVELSIHGATQVIGRWRIHSDRIAEVGFALAESIALIRADGPLTYGQATDSTATKELIAEVPVFASSWNDGQATDAQPRVTRAAGAGSVGGASAGDSVIGRASVGAGRFGVATSGDGGGSR